MKINILLSLMLLAATTSGIAQPSVVFRWNFDQPAESMQILGKGTTVPGVKGLAYQFDGFTSAIDALAGTEIKMPAAFTISAWVAIIESNEAPVLVISNWGPEKLKLRIDGVEIPHGPDFRYATEYAIDGTPTTIVFIKLAAQSEKRIELQTVTN
jgi:hypothetical protein